MYDLHLSINLLLRLVVTICHKALVWVKIQKLKQCWLMLT